jgi:hypothetical protein
MKRYSTISMTLLLALAVSSCKSVDPTTGLSEKARGFAVSVRNDSANCVVMLHRFHYSPERRITFFSGTQPNVVLQPIEISRAEMIRMVDWFAAKGLLDKTDGLPYGKVVGWYLVVTAGKEHRVERFLGIGQLDLLKQPDVLGVRSVLKRKTGKRWDTFVAQVQEEAAPNN